LQLFALHDVVRLGGTDNAASRLITLAPDVEGHWSPCFAEHARAFIADMAARSTESRRSSKKSVHCSWLPKPPPRQAPRSRGPDVPAPRGARRLGPVYSPLPAKARARQLDRPLPLTRREREVAKLAATGIPSHAIAEQLFVSVRTVEGHLQNIYGKLGVDGRRGLARVLRESQHAQPVSDF
jgi:DNA-binding CsgD family transcriptional regulator